MGGTGLRNPAHRSLYLYDRLGQRPDRPFYTGAMAEARQIELQPIAEQAGGLDLVVISPNDPEAMLRHTDECRVRQFNFVADPSQQLAWLDGSQIKRLIDGATYLFSNDYEDA